MNILSTVYRVLWAHSEFSPICPFTTHHSPLTIHAITGLSSFSEFASNSLHSSTAMTMLDRLLQFIDNDSSRISEGPIAVLIVVFCLFCLIWTPLLCQRNCLIRQEDQRRRRAEESVAEIIRFNSGNLNLLALGVDDGSSNNQGGRMNQNNIQGLSVEDRRDLIKNILVSRKIVEVSKQEPPSTDDDGDLPFDANSNEETKKTTLLLADVVDVESTTKHISVEPCPICLNNYKEGEILCWSQNSNCKHCFHRDCMEEWLMAHKECPCCRHNYLSLGPEDEDQINIGDEQANSAGAENYSFPRGAQLFYLLTRLQSLADTRPNTTIRLEGVELANGRRGNLEIQRATDSSFEVGGRGLNVRVEEESDNQRLENNEGLHLDLPTALQRFMHHESGRASSNNEIDDGVNGNRQPPRLDP